MAFSASNMVLWADGNAEKLYKYTAASDSMATVLADGYFGDSVCQVNAIVQTDVAFDNCGLGVALGDDQVTRMGRGRTAVASRNEEQMNRPLDHDASRHMDESTVANKRRIQGRKAGVIVARKLSEMIFDEHRMVGQRRGQTANDGTVGSRSRR